MPNSARNNLDILINTYVTRLLPTGRSSSGNPAFRTVEFAQQPGKATKTLTAQKEVVLSAGSVGTPQLLMLSGIGDKSALTKVGITSTVDLPDVGQNLQDHLYITIPYSVNSTQTFDTEVFNQTLFGEMFKEYETNRTGIFANNAIANQIGFFRLPNMSPILRAYGDPSSGPKSPHYEFAFCNGFVATTQQPPTSGNYFSLAIVLVTPTSRGSIQLQSSSVFDHPLINPNYLSSKPDMDIFVEAVKAGQRLLTAPTWKGYLEAPFEDAANLTSDSSIRDYIRSKAISIRHPVSTAAMSKNSDRGGVVGPDLLVKGVDGLRVVDASVLPFTPAAHPQAAVYIIAERAADIIKAAYNLSA
jgi:choline dehydrogenase